jgi:ABC-type bacteriocin/lantibiotic exporter with double-glycine peptidase domain
VVDQNQEYIWQRGNRDLQYKISATSKPVEGLRSELNGGATPMEAISKTFGEDALDLSGCKAEQIAYVMNQGKPVIAVTENKKYVILIGYTETDVTYVEAKNGKSHTVSLEKMDKKANGNYIGS